MWKSLDVIREFQRALLSFLSKFFDLFFGGQNCCVRLYKHFFFQPIFIVACIAPALAIVETTVFAIFTAFAVLAVTVLDELILARPFAHARQYYTLSIWMQRMTQTMQHVTFVWFGLDLSFIRSFLKDDLYVEFMRCKYQGVPKLFKTTNLCQFRKKSLRALSSTGPVDDHSVGAVALTGDYFANRNPEYNFSEQTKSNESLQAVVLLLTSILACSHVWYFEGIELGDSHLNTSVISITIAYALFSLLVYTTISVNVDGKWGLRTAHFLSRNLNSKEVQRFYEIQNRNLYPLKADEVYFQPPYFRELSLMLVVDMVVRMTVTYSFYVLISATALISAYSLGDQYFAKYFLRYSIFFWLIMFVVPLLCCVAFFVLSYVILHFRQLTWGVCKLIIVPSLVLATFWLVTGQLVEFSGLVGNLFLLVAIISAFVELIPSIFDKRAGRLYPLAASRRIGFRRSLDKDGYSILEPDESDNR